MEEAAKKVGISKKSLDDYFLQLKNGKANGFNFNEHKSDKIGILRNWNKHHKVVQQSTTDPKGVVAAESPGFKPHQKKGRKVGSTKLALQARKISKS